MGGQEQKKREKKNLGKQIEFQPRPKIHRFIFGRLVCLVRDDVYFQLYRLFKRTGNYII